jgi:hypothetical protein
MNSIRQSVAVILLLALAASAVAADDAALEIAMEAAAVAATRVQLTPPEADLLRQTGRALRESRIEAAQQDWALLISSRELLGMDVNALVLWIVRESYLSATEDLRFAAEKVRYFNEQKRALRNLLEAARSCGWARCRSEAAVRAQIQRWEEALASIGDDAQLANVDLQNILQQQQQTLQMISNVSKLLHDTAFAVIRKIGG